MSQSQAFKLLDIIQKENGFDTYTQIAETFGITPGAINGLLRRNAVDTILKRATKNGMNSSHLLYCLKNYDDYIYFYKLKNQKIKTIEEFKKGFDSINELLEWVKVVNPNMLECVKEEFEKFKNEPQKMADVKRHIQNQSRTKNLHDNVQKVIEFEATQSPTTSPYSELFQILVGENKDAIFQILSDKLEIENVDDVEKMRFIEDFEGLIKHVVSPAAKLKMLERLKSKYR